MNAAKFDYDTVVIGGGFAGVSACRDLADQGYSVLLLEARHRLGGRTWSEQRTVGDFEGVIELGGQWVWPDRQVNMMAEIERYGLNLTHSAMPERYPTFLAGKYNEGPLPVPVEDVYDFEKAAFKFLTDAHRIQRGVPLDRQNLDDLDIPFSEYLDNLGVSDATRGFFTFFGTVFQGRNPEDISALLPLAFIAQMDHSLIGAWGILDAYIVEGTSALINAMAEDSGADIRFETPVARVVQDEDGVTVTTQAGDAFTARTVVVATPVACWADIQFEPPLSEVKFIVSSDGGVAKVCKVYAQVKNAPRLPYMIADAPAANGAAIISGAYDLDEDGQLMIGFFIDDPDNVDRFGADFAGIERFVKTMCPEAELVAYECHEWVSDPWAGYGGYPAYKPGRLSKGHSELTRPEGRLFFATADIANTFMVWMEGAVEMGKKAALDSQRRMERDALEIKVHARARASSDAASARNNA
ncbi:flavin monoamine oxidase family protein [Rhodococcus opacus]|uniref:Putative oxidoreductase n=1 Tax=Rhodococcus opacus (strain B4) TaxID=632772 RepID=C1ASB6_RHOOB|nr:NAD(P)/FAD-dependent oxidoreductase [Rhodococcus opacus]BAH48365.1 putative oxidoreductase [Rhodococcus opacus B4]